MEEQERNRERLKLYQEAVKNHKDDWEEIQRQRREKEREFDRRLIEADNDRTSQIMREEEERKKKEYFLQDLKKQIKEKREIDLQKNQEQFEQDRANKNLLIDDEAANWRDQMRKQHYQQVIRDQLKEHQDQKARNWQEQNMEDKAFRERIRQKQMEEDEQRRMFELRKKQVFLQRIKE